MKTLSLFIMMLAISKINAQIQSSCKIPQALQVNYESDIRHLALKRIFDQNSIDTNSIVIPQTYKDTIWQGLAAIYNLNSIIERDSVFDKYCIHQSLSDYIFQQIYVRVDASYSWTQQWQNRKTTTGITALDNLLSTYGFTVTSFSNLIKVATLTTTQNINVRPLCDSIETFNGVIYSEPTPPRGGGDEITYNKVGNDRFYDFTVGYGDCLSGCTAKHTFKFKVSNSCLVHYLGVFDITAPLAVLPKPINCNITANIKHKNIITESIKIYPNPVSNNIFVESVQDGKIEIFNLQGQLVINTATNQTTTKVDLSNLSRGVYIIKATADNEIIIKKIIKQ